MIVEEVMVPKPFTIKKSQSLSDAQKLMVKHSIRHLPVMDKGSLLGIITESDIRCAFIDGNSRGKTVLNPSKMLVSDYMTQDPLTAAPETNIEDAALIIYKHKVGALPVVAKNKLVGIISIMDMLGLFVDMMGLLHSSSRIDIAIGKNPKDFEQVSGIITGHDLNIISVALTPPKHCSPQGRKKKQVFSFRLELCEIKQVVKDIEKAGFNVVEAID
ncbi:MAG: CBS domain-containing protein [Nitrospinae bacterium]|nr:CBS domain-containing protein [Nitrospinota bacterium]